MQTLLQRFKSGESLTLGEVVNLAESHGDWVLTLWTNQLKSKIRTRWRTVGGEQ